MPNDIAQVVDGTITVISEDVKMRMISNPIRPKSFSYPKKIFLISKQRMESKTPYLYDKNTIIFANHGNSFFKD